MNRRILRNQIIDKAELESASSNPESSGEEYSENEDEQAEASSDESNESDSSEIEPLPQETLESITVNPDSRLNSKNGLIIIYYYIQEKHLYAVEDFHFVINRIFQNPLCYPTCQKRIDLSRY